MKILKPFEVSLHENKDHKFVTLFYCLAEESDHAKEQAIDAYPLSKIIRVSKCSKEEYPYVIHEE